MKVTSSVADGDDEMSLCDYDDDYSDCNDVLF